MKILFCNIAYMLHYEGKTSRDIPLGAGKWVKENQDAHEKWNFLNYNGFCYGFVMNNGEEFHIERIEDTAPKSDLAENVTVIWCAPKSKSETVVVGWYENASVYRQYRGCVNTPITGLQRDYFTSAKAEDCYLLPENLRTFVIDRASVIGAGKGFGQQNYWYAESAYARTELIPRTMAFLQENRCNRINRISKDFEFPNNLAIPLTNEESALADEHYANSEYELFLPLGYRRFEATPTADDAFYIAIALREMFQFDNSLSWFRKVVDMEGESWETNSLLPYLYMQCELYEDAIIEAQELLQFDQGKEPKVRDEIYSIIADAYCNMGQISDGIKWLDRILEESGDEKLIRYTKGARDYWLQQT